MGIFDMVKKGAGMIQGALEERQAKIAHYKEMLEPYDDEGLKRVFRNATGEKKIAAGILLRERGYGSSED